MITSVQAVFHGRVQGVWFRAWTQGEALKLGLSGWVRNCADGTVEAVFSGEDENVAAMLDKARKGPPLARVDNITTEPANAPEGPGFHKLPTA